MKNEQFKGTQGIHMHYNRVTLIKVKQTKNNNYNKNNKNNN